MNKPANISGYRRFWIYSLVLFLLAWGIGELFYRVFSLDFDPFADIGYQYATNQYDRLKQYIKLNGPPDCIFAGNSLVQVGINPVNFETAFYEKSGKVLHCYNLGIDGSTMSSTVPIVMIGARMGRPSYLVIGVQAGQFLTKLDLDFCSTLTTE